MKRGTAAKVILGKDTLMDVPSGIVHGTDVILGGKAGLLNDFGGLVLSNNLMLGKKVSRGTITTVTVRGQSPLVLPDAIAGSLQAVKAFGGTYQGIPDGYTLVDFVMSDANSYIETGISVNDSDEVNFYWHVDRTGSIFAFSQGASSDNAAYQLANATIVNPAGVVFDIENYTPYRVLTGVSANTNAMLHIQIINKEIFINGVSYGTSSGTLTNPTDKLRLFCSSAGVSSVSYMGRFTVKGKIDLFPCTRDSDGAVGFYDAISGAFLTNAGTGTLTAGLPRTTIGVTPDNPVQIVSNNGVLKARHQSGLPLGYQMVDWLKPNNGVTITGFKTKSTQEITAVFYRESSAAAFIYWSDTSSSGTTNTSAYITSNGNWRWDGKTIVTTPAQQTKITSIQSADGLFFNGEARGAYTDASEFVSNNDLTLSSSQNTSVRIYSLTIREGETVTLDLVPVQRLSDSAYGFYDKVSGNFYTNADVTFVAGAVIDDPVEIYTDGTVETINVHGTNLLDLANCTDGYYYSPAGEYTAAASTRLSNYIPVKAGVAYTVFCAGVQGNANVRVNLLDTGKNWLSQTVFVATGGASFTKTVTPTQDGFLAFSANLTSSSYVDWSTAQVVQGSYTVATMPEYAPYYDGGTATAEMLLKVGDYQDEQEILSGVITRNVGVKVLDGTEDWKLGSTSERPFYLSDSIDGSYALPNTPFCTHFQGVASTVASLAMPDLTIRCGYEGYEKSLYIKYKSLYSSGVAAFKQFLADQYAAGTPVIIVYPLATPTTESVAGQTLQVTGGDNILEITQASLANLELEATYKSLVQLTIQEVEDANLNNNVEVTIS